MAKKSNPDLFATLRAGGLRKKVARSVADAVGAGRHDGDAPRAATGVVADLRRMATTIEDRVADGPRKRSAAAKKAAATRRRNAAQRSTAAKKGARTRAAKR